jgi:hypothetical protein
MTPVPISEYTWSYWLATALRTISRPVFEVGSYVQPPGPLVDTESSSVATTPVNGGPDWLNVTAMQPYCFSTFPLIDTGATTATVLPSERVAQSNSVKKP